MASRQLVAYILIVLLIAAIPIFWWWVRRRFRRESDRDDRHMRIDLNASGRSPSDAPSDRDRSR